MAKASLKSYFEPTPKLFRKIGIAIASFGNTFGVGTAIHGYFETNPETIKLNMYIAVGSCLLGWLGKEMTNFFEESPEEPTNE